MSRAKWNQRYAGNETRSNGPGPAQFLSENAELLPSTGVALDIAAGEGRNAIFLAETGLTVIAIDFADQALRRCTDLARRRRVRVEAVVADLDEFVMRRDFFDLIVSFNFLQRELASAIVEALKPGGTLIYETLTLDHLKWMPGFKPEYLLGPGELLKLFRGLHLIKYREKNDDGKAVAGIIARKY